MKGTRDEDRSWLEVLTSPLAVQIEELEARGMPRTGVLFLQNACENRCFFCANPGVTSPPEDAITRPEQIDRWIEGARGIAVERICVGGTEPALHPSFERALRLLAGEGLAPVEVMTSGLRLAEPGVARRWSDLGVRSIAVPLYSASASVHDEVVGASAALERTARGLDAARSAGIEVLVHTLALRRTLGELAALAQLARGRWGSRLAIGPARPKEAVYAWSEHAPTVDELAGAVRGLDVSLVAFPLCVAPDARRGAAAVIELYFRSTRTEFPSACLSCLDRPRCPGVVAAELERGAVVRPRMAC